MIPNNNDNTKFFYNKVNARFAVSQLRQWRGNTRSCQFAKAVVSNAQLSVRFEPRPHSRCVNALTTSPEAHNSSSNSVAVHSYQKGSAESRHYRGSPRLCKFILLLQDELWLRFSLFLFDLSNPSSSEQCCLTS